MARGLYLVEKYLQFRTWKFQILNWLYLYIYSNFQYIINRLRIRKYNGWYKTYYGEHIIYVSSNEVTDKIIYYIWYYEWNFDDLKKYFQLRNFPIMYKDKVYGFHINTAEKTAKFTIGDYETKEYKELFDQPDFSFIIN